MKNIDTDFLNHLRSGNKKTIVNAVKITSVLTSDIYYLTDSYKDIVISGNTYDSNGKFTISSSMKGNGNQVDNLTITNVINPSGSNLFTIAKKKLLEGAQVDIFLVNREDNSQIYQDFKGFISRVKIKNFTFDIEIEGLASLLLQNIMKTYEYACPLIFGNSECGFDTSTVTETGTITSVTDRLQFIDTSRTEADNFFRFGILTWTAGNNNELTREVKSYNGISKEFLLYEPMQYDIEIGDTYSVYQGCDKDPDTCKDDFNNFLNFQGYLHLVPPQEKLTYIPPDEEEG